MSDTKEPSPDGNRWFRISERQLYFLEQLAEQYGAMCEVLQPGTARLPVPDGISYVGLREEIRQQSFVDHSEEAMMYRIAIREKDPMGFIEDYKRSKG